jgi:predicted XRE-type DNA-binding protein
VNEIERSSGNVYEDIGVSNPEDMLVKAQLMAKINQIINDRRWTQVVAAKAMGVPQPKLSNMLRGHFENVSEAKMMDCLRRLGCDVQIVIGKPHAEMTAGRLGVVLA